MFAYHLNWSISTLHPSSSSSSSCSSTRSHISTASSLSSTFSDSSSDPIPSPNPPSSPSPRTHAFFASPFSPTTAQSKSVQDYTTSPIQTSPRSLTADFFASPPSSARPTPPPSIYTSSSIPTSPFTSKPNSRDPSPSPYPSLNLSPAHFPQVDRTNSNGVLSAPPTHKTPRLPPLSRFFPSRYNSDPNPELLPSSPGPFERGFRDLDDDTSHPYSKFHIEIDGDSKPQFQVAVPESTSLSASPPPFTSLESHLLSTSQVALEPGTILKPDNVSDKGKGAISLKLIRTLGRGAFSCVWLAKDVYGIVKRGGRDEEEEKLVAVKLSPGTDNDPIAGLTFKREAEILHHISHTNIVPLLSSFTFTFPLLATPTPVLVLPYIPGTDLLDLVNSDVRHAQLGEEVLRRIVRELVSVLAWLHKVARVVHRDVKLENVLLTTSSPTPSTPSPLIKLTDFGLARAVHEHGDGVELLSTRCGSEAYAAPELVVGGHAQEAGADVAFAKGARGREKGWYDGRATDAWAVGVLIYALVCRGLPFGEGVPNPKLERGGNIEIGREERGDPGASHSAVRSRKFN